MPAIQFTTKILPSEACLRLIKDHGDRVFAITDSVQQRRTERTRAGRAIVQWRSGRALFEQPSGESRIPSVAPRKNPHPRPGDSRSNTPPLAETTTLDLAVAPTAVYGFFRYSSSGRRAPERRVNCSLSCNAPRDVARENRQQQHSTTNKFGTFWQPPWPPCLGVYTSKMVAEQKMTPTSGFRHF